jgi:hypothetical protein
MNFVLPQFIDMEAKIVGPLTLKQFIFVAIGTTFSFLVYFSLGKTSMPLAIALIAIIEGIACALAFVKMDGISLPVVIRHYMLFAMSPQIFLWKNFELPNQLATTREKIVIQKAPTNIKIEVSTKKDNVQKIRDYLETK